MSLIHDINQMPPKPGVYLFKDENDQVIYVGKARLLNKRVKQYFQNIETKALRTQNLVKSIHNFEYFITDSEMEALILENNLIKKYNPKYNVLLKDDKSFPYIKITKEAFPKIYLTRSRKNDRNFYFGPYTDVKAARNILELIQRIWYVRTCNRRLPKDIGKQRPCLHYHIGRCKAPCSALITQEEYQKNIEEAIDFLQGKYENIVTRLKEEMAEAAKVLDFEEAAAIRNKILSIKKINEKQKMENTSDVEQDILAVASKNNDSIVQLFFLRGGKITGHEHYYLTNTFQIPEHKILSEFIKQFYSGGMIVPKEIVIGANLEDEQILSDWLSSLRGSRVLFVKPQKGEKFHMLRLAKKNAAIGMEQFYEKMKREKEKYVQSVLELKELLQLDELKRMEAYDISNVQGFESVGSMVVFEEGKPKKNAYRKFKIRDVLGPDDYASMQEVIKRRFVHGLKEREEMKDRYLEQSEGKFTVFPDLLLIDGGRGHVNSVKKILDDLGLTLPVCGMIKDDKHKTRGLWYEDREIVMDRFSESFKLICRIQDEVHRFAIDYHRKLHQKTMLHSSLDEISGIGKIRKNNLLKHFGSIAEIKKASPAQLACAEGISKSLAQKIYDFYH